MQVVPPSQAYDPTKMNHSKVEIGIKCNDLLNKDIASLSDPVAFLYQRSSTKQDWAYVGRTEWIHNNLNPEFTTKITMDFIFEAIQQLKVEIYDVDDEKHITDKSKQDFLGSAETDLASLVTSEGCSSTIKLDYKDGKKYAGTVTLMATEVKDCSDVAEICISCKKLAKKNTFSSDPFFTIERMRGKGEYEKIYTSEFYKRELSPKFNPVKIPVSSLCNGNMDQPIRFKIWDWESRGDHNLIGIFEKTLGELQETTEFELFNPEAKKEKDRKKAQGKVMIDRCRVMHIPSFLDFVQSGLRFHLSVAVDFTGSNGDPKSPHSLHYMDPSGDPNEYLAAISSVTEILTQYIGNDEILASGFGAVIPPARAATHIFPLDLDSGNYVVHGVPELITRYANTLSRVILSGPTNFAPTLKSSITMAEQLQRDRPFDFFVQLIITDGEISDMTNTIRAIIEASKRPMSIIIIGVGSSSFDSMDRLDADDGRLKIDGMTQLYDNVQFVPFRNYAGRPYELAGQVLAELPSQVIEYMMLNGIKPTVVTAGGM